MRYEVEIKCLISERQARKLPDKIRALSISVTRHAQYEQLNDYFIGGDLVRLAERLRLLLGDERAEELIEIAREYDTFSVRARQNGTNVIIMVKAAKNVSANHSTRRREFEASVNLSLGALGEQISASGYELQARWMANRTIYNLSNGITLDIYFSPGYGYQVEFEKIVRSSERMTGAETEIRQFVGELGFDPADPVKLERLFEYYNLHWRDYYNTRKTFDPEQLV